MVYYNTYLLTELLQRKQKQLDGAIESSQVDAAQIEEEDIVNGTAQWLQEAVATIKQVSSVAWRHIHIYGTYQFVKPDDLISWEDVIKDVEL